MALTDDDVREILRLIDESDVEELRVETEGLSLYVLRGAAAAPDAGAEPSMRAAARAVSSSPAPADAATAVDAQADGAATGDLLTIAAPMLGTFYRAEAPGSAPFVGVGGRVEPDTIVCLIEVMKMMNPIPAGVAGTIVDVCVDNAQPVEYGAPLFQVQADR